MEEKFEEWDQALEECDKKLKEFDEWFTNIKIELERRDTIIDRYSDGFTYISDSYGK